MCSSYNTGLLVNLFRKLNPLSIYALKLNIIQRNINDTKSLLYNTVVRAEEDGMRLDRFVKYRANYPVSLIQKWIRQQKVTLDHHIIIFMKSEKKIRIGVC